nr:hypothetical protein [Limnofasciculus baicalensis]
MIQSISKTMTLDEFLDWYPDGYGRFELYIGNPKRPVILVYQLVDGEYIVSEFRENQRIISVTFPELNLTAEEIFRVGE